jgi:hypothetical protein
VRFQYPAIVLFDVEFVVDFHQAASRSIPAVRQCPRLG